MANEEQGEVQTSIAKSALRAAVGLGLFAVLTAGLIAFVQVGTKERIIVQETKARLSALYELVPEDYRDNDLLADSYPLFIKNPEATGDVFIAKREDVTRAIVLPWTALDGYTGPIALLVAIDVSGELIGVRVVDHKETPGLGDKIETSKSNWVLHFNGRSLSNTPTKEWAVKKDGGAFDQLTGATITPRAVVSAVYAALRFFEDNKQALLNQAPQTELVLVSSVGSTEQAH